MGARAPQRMAVCAIPGELRGYDARSPVHRSRRIMSPYFALASPYFSGQAWEPAATGDRYTPPGAGMGARAPQRMAVCAIPGEMRGHDARSPVHRIQRIMSPYIALASPYFRGRRPANGWRAGMGACPWPTCGVHRPNAQRVMCGAAIPCAPAEWEGTAAGGLLSSARASIRNLRP